MADSLDKKNQVGRLLITADDVCVSSSIDTAVIDLARKGIVTNAAVMANWGSFSSANKLMEADCSISYHYNLSSGVPISELSSVQSLINADGSFYEPSSFKSPTDSSLEDCIWRYNEAIVPSFDISEVIRELKNQSKFIKKNIDRDIIFSSFHHDLDKHPIIRSIFDINGNDLLESRQILLEKKRLSGFEYSLFDQSETYESYKSKIINCIGQAIKKSALFGGIPYEIAIHPAIQTDGLSKFTVYEEERLIEYKVWDSVSIYKIFYKSVHFYNLTF